MNPRIKNGLGLILIVLLIVLAYAALAYVSAYNNSVYPPAFTVTGEGKVVAVPDIAKFSFSVITQGGQDIASLQTDNTTKANAVIDFLKDQGIKEADIKTSTYSIEPRYNNQSLPAMFESYPDRAVIYPSTVVQSDNIVGYTVTQSVEVTVRDFEKVGDLLNGVVAAGANNVSNFRFTFDDPIELTNQAREEAIDQAKRKAKMIAKAGGFRVGRLLSIEEGGFYPYGKAYGLGGGDMAVSEAAIPPNLEPGSEELVVNVTLRYGIRD